MKETEISRVFPVRVERAFELCSDLEKAPERIEAIRSLEVLGGGPVQAGTRFRETRVMFGRPHEEEMEIQDWAPPKGYSVVCDSHGTHYRTVHTFAPEGEDRTRVTLRFAAEPHGLLAKIMSFFFGGRMSKMVARCIGEDLDDLVRWAEAEQGPSAEGSATQGA